MTLKKRVILAVVLLFVVMLTFPITKEITTLNPVDNFSIECADETGLFATTATSSNLRFDTFAANYFYNLTDYHANVSGSCGYIALQMLLSFYNHYWNDNLVAEQYETTATGNYGLNTRTPGTTDAFHDLLVQLGARLEYGLSLPSFESIKQILDLYLQTYRTNEVDRWITFQDYNYDKTATYPGSSESNSLFFARQIKTYVQSNIPVIVVIDDYVNGASVQHACIAYGYDESAQRLLFNTGWKQYHDANTLEREDDCIVGYITLLPKNIEHVHSSNFKMNNSNVCSCTLPDHAHKYEYASNNNSTVHTRTCFCGYSDTERHTFDIVTIKKLICSKCSYSKPNNGELEPILPYIKNPNTDINK